MRGVLISLSDDVNLPRRSPEGMPVARGEEEGVLDGIWGHPATSPSLDHAPYALIAYI